MPFDGRTEPGGRLDERNGIRTLLVEAVDDVAFQVKTGRDGVACLSGLPLGAGHDKIRRERVSPFHKSGRLRLSLVRKRP